LSFLLDTHIWLWHTLGSDKLPRGLRETIERSPEVCWLSPISVWEAALLAKNRRLDLLLDFRPWLSVAFQRFPLKEAPFNFEVALRSQELSLPHRDPADHLLAATALVHGLTLLTVDRRLTSLDWLPTRAR
jgi:PIN domain nuclease of toxin-antitoxin system